MNYHFLALIVLFASNWFAANAQDLNSAQKQLAYQAALDFQAEMNEKFADSAASPLKRSDRETFSHLNFFPVDTTSFVVLARFEKLENQKAFAMQTTTDRLPEYRRYAKLYFTIDGKAFQLFVYQNVDLIKLPQYKKYLFIPFTDLTNGFDSYGGGRYLDMEIPDDDEIILNFNKAYNPYCAYNEKYSCPIPPKENHLNIAIRAGVMMY